jgi:hypothetical protein
MHEAKGYDKSFIDGTIKEHIKMKPDVEIKGVVTIQLFDEKGKLEREIKTENRITDSIARMAFMDYFCCRIRGNPWGVQYEYNDDEVGSSISVKDSNYTEQNGSYSYFTAPFRHFFLTDDASPEEGFARAIKGNIIGWADKSRPYAGSSTVKGTINLSESFFTESNLHFVFDFPTSVANGKFQKLWWCEMKYDSSTQEILYGLKEISRNFKLDSYSSKSKNIPASTNFTPGNYSSYRFRVFKYNNKLYTIGVNYNTAKVCMAIINLDTEEYTEVDLYTTMGLTSSSYRPSAYLMAQENNYVYMMYPSYSNRLHILNLDDNTKTEIILSDSYYNLIGKQIPEIPSNWYSSIDSYLQNGMMACKNGRLYIPLRYYNGSTSKTFILVCNPDENLTKTALYDLSTVGSPAGPFSTSAMSLDGYDLKLQSRDADTWFVCNGSYTFITDNSFNIIDIGYRDHTFDYRYFLEDTPGCAIKKYYVPSGSQIYQWQYYWSIWEPIAAMTLLPSPVTKTPTNTMKIQYDFNIQRVDPFQP